MLFWTQPWKSIDSTLTLTREWWVSQSTPDSVFTAGQSQCHRRQSFTSSQQLWADRGQSVTRIHQKPDDTQWMWPHKCFIYDDEVLNNALAHVLCYSLSCGTITIQSNCVSLSSETETHRQYQSQAGWFQTDVQFMLHDLANRIQKWKAEAHKFAFCSKT